MYYLKRAWTFYSAFSIFFTHSTPFTQPWKAKQIETLRPHPALRLNLLPNTQIRIDVVGRDINFQKKPHVFWGIFPTTFPWIEATVWGSYTFPFTFRQVSALFPINGTLMFMYSWFPREYELKDHISKSESIIIGRLSLLMINFKVCSSSIFSLTNLELLLPDCSLCKVWFETLNKTIAFFKTL